MYKKSQTFEKSINFDFMFVTSNFDFRASTHNLKKPVNLDIPISHLSSVSKIFEKIIHSRLKNYLNAINAITHFQFGFKLNHFTT